MHRELNYLLFVFPLFVSGHRHRAVGDGGALTRARLLRQLADGHSGGRGGLMGDFTAALQMVHRAA